jgi:nicotinate phosphoribosyltransferase
MDRPCSELRRGIRQFHSAATRYVLVRRKQVFRQEEDEVARRDVLARHGEVLPGRPLLRQVMRAGRRQEGASPSLEALRAHAREELARLPLEVTRLEPARPAYPVEERG